MKNIFITVLLIGILFVICEAIKTKGTGFLRCRCAHPETLAKKAKKKCPPGSKEVPTCAEPMQDKSKKKTSEEEEIDKQMCCLKDTRLDKGNYKNRRRSGFIPPIIKKGKRSVL